MGTREVWRSQIRGACVRACVRVCVCVCVCVCVHACTHTYATASAHALSSHLPHAPHPSCSHAHHACNTEQCAAGGAAGDSAQVPMSKFSTCPRFHVPPSQRPTPFVHACSSRTHLQEATAVRWARAAPLSTLHAHYTPLTRLPPLLLFEMLAFF